MRQFCRGCHCNNIVEIFNKSMLLFAITKLKKLLYPNNVYANAGERNPQMLTTCFTAFPPDCGTMTLAILQQYTSAGVTMGVGRVSGCLVESVWNKLNYQKVKSSIRTMFCGPVICIIHILIFEYFKAVYVTVVRIQSPFHLILHFV